MTKRECLLLHKLYSTDPELAFDELADDDFINLVEEFAKGVKAANEETKCECCGRKVSKFKTLEVRLPIIIHDDEEKYMSAKDMLICEQCANIIMNAYYTEAHDHSRSGWIGVAEEIT